MFLDFVLTANIPPQAELTLDTKYASVIKIYQSGICRHLCRLGVYNCSAWPSNPTHQEDFGGEGVRASVRRLKFEPLG